MDYEKLTLEELKQGYRYDKEMQQIRTDNLQVTITYKLSVLRLAL